MSMKHTPKKYQFPNICLNAWDKYSLDFNQDDNSLNSTCFFGKEFKGL